MQEKKQELGEYNKQEEQRGRRNTELRIIRKMNRIRMSRKNLRKVESGVAKNKFLFDKICVFL